MPSPSVEILHQPLIRILGVHRITGSSSKNNTARNGKEKRNDYEKLQEIRNNYKQGRQIERSKITKRAKKMIIHRPGEGIGAEVIVVGSLPVASDLVYRPQLGESLRKASDRIG